MGISRLVVASHNQGKVVEIRALLEPFGVETVSVGELGLPVPEETEDTFAGNASLKALAAARAAGAHALSDDSGMCVDALCGAPGVVSADWAEDGSGGPRDFGRAMARVERELRAKFGGTLDGADLSARFVCALALAAPDGAVEVFEGVVRGRLVFPGRGDKGFGYDPIFIPDGHMMTFAEMEPADKHAMSHRADAFAKLVAARFGAPVGDG